jgi:DNA-directed RNA polymerase subunit RPC12/RpoP
MTSPIERVKVTCPQCGHLYEDWYRASLNLDLDDFDDEYIDSATSAVCPKCSFKVYFGTLIVRDGIFFASAEVTPESDDS